MQCSDCIEEKAFKEIPVFLTIFPSCPPTYILVVASKARGRYELKEHWVDKIYCELYWDCFEIHLSVH